MSIITLITCKALEYLYAFNFMKLIPDESKQTELSLLSIQERFLPWISRTDFVSLLEAYLDALSEIQKKINLTGSSLRKDMLYHVQESLELFFLLDERYQEDSINLLDVGSGGGFPAIPLATALPSWRIVMTESTQKKAIFLNWIKQGLNLSNTLVYSGRVEDWIETKPAYRCDILTAKGVGKTLYLMNLARALLKPKGLLILWKNIAEVEGQLKSNSDFTLDKMHTTSLGKTVLSVRYSGKKARVR